jgi:hypothetical protein
MTYDVVTGNYIVPGIDVVSAATNISIGESSRTPNFSSPTASIITVGNLTGTAWNQSAFNSIAIGHATAQGSGTLAQSNNILIGNYTQRFNFSNNSQPYAGSSNIVLGNGSAVEGSDNLIIGHSLLTEGEGLVAIGSTVDPIMYTTSPLITGQTLNWNNLSTAKAKVSINGGFSAKQIVLDKSSNYSILAEDAGSLIRSTGSAITITVTDILADGEQVDFIQAGSGQITFAGSGITINSADAKLKTAKQYAAATLKKAGGAYYLIGNLG